MKKEILDYPKKFRKELLEFIDHNLQLGYITKDMSVEDFRKFVDITLNDYFVITGGIIDANELLDKLAGSIDMRTSIFDDVKDMVDSDIKFPIIFNSDKYITPEEKTKLQQKSFIGG